MSRFGTLLNYEMKKILQKKSVWMTMTIMIGIMIFVSCSRLFGSYYIEGEFFETHAQTLRKDNGYARAMSGRPVDDTLLTELRQAFAKISADMDTHYAATEEYQTQVRPYLSIYELVSDFTQGTGKDPLLLDGEELYQARRELVENHWESYRLTEEEIHYWEEKEGHFKEPVIYEYAGFWEEFAMYDAYMLGLLLTFLTAICVTGVFSDEHNRRTDQLLLCSRFGKKELYGAKLLAGSLFCLCGAAVLIGVTLICNLAIWGADGFHGAVQLYVPGYSYPMTIGQLFFILLFLVLLLSVLYGITAMVLAEWLHNSVGVMGIMTGVLFAARLIQIPPSWGLLSRVWNYLPSNLLYADVFLDPRLVSLFGEQFTIWQFAPVLCILAIVLLVLVGKWRYLRYQVSGR